MGKEKGRKSRWDRLGAAVIELLESRQLLSAFPAGAQAQVNTFTTDDQFSAAVATDSGGNFVVVWGSVGSAGTDSSGYSIQGQRYNAAGAAQGIQFQVNTYTTSNQGAPSVAMDSDGDFVVVWLSYGSADTDTSDSSIQAQRFNALGIAQGAQFQVNAYTTHFQSDPSVSMDAAGDFVIAWVSGGSFGGDPDYSIQARRYNSAGVAQGSEFQVNTYTTLNQLRPSVAMNAAGDFVVAWQSNGNSSGDTSGTSIQAMRYNARGVAQGAQFQVNSYTTNAQVLPSVAMDASGGFVIAWESNGSPGSDNLGYSIQAQRYTAAAIGQGPQFQVNTYTTSQQVNPAVSLDAAGNAVVTWQSLGGSGIDTDATSIQAQRYNSGNSAAGGQFQVNTYTTSSQDSPSVATDRDGNFVIAWQSLGSSGGDTNAASIQLQRYIHTPEVNTITANDQALPSVALDGAGNFVIAWYSNGSFGTDTLAASIQAQRYNAIGVPLGSQFQVNTYTTSNQSNPSVAMDAAGNFVIAWGSTGSYGTDSSFDSVQAQRYNAAGTAQGAQFQVNTYTSGNQGLPSVAMDAAGNFLIAWQSAGSFGSDLNGSSIQAQRYNAAGAPLGAEFQVNSFFPNAQVDPSAAMNASGNFVIAWASVGGVGTDGDDSIQAQRYNAAGTAQGPQFQVNTYTTSSQSRPSAAMDAAGNFLITWQSNFGSGTDSNGSIQAQRYNAAGTAQGAQFQVNTYTTGIQSNPSVAMDAAGDFVVSWQSFGSLTDSSDYSIQAQRYNPVGVSQGGQFEVNTYTTSYQAIPGVAMDAAGDFVVVWTSKFQDGSSYGAYFRRYAAISPYQVNTYTTDEQHNAAVATDPSGGYVVAWESYGSSGTDTDGASIVARRFNALGTPVGAQFQVNTYSAGNQLAPSIAMDSSGNFIIAWYSAGSSGADSSGSGILAQRFNASGLPAGSEFQVNGYTTSNQFYPSIAADSAGNFVVAWESFASSGTDTSGFSIQAQRFNSAGAVQGATFQVNTYTTNGQEFPSVAMDSTGNFVVVWRSLGGAVDNSGYSVQGQRYTAAGAAQGAQFQVNGFIAGDQAAPSVAMNAAGFTVVWQSVGSFGSDSAGKSIQAQRYNSIGSALGGQFQVNTYTTTDQTDPAVAINASGDLVVSWVSLGSSESDTSTYSIQAQRYNSAGAFVGPQFQVNTYTTSAQTEPAVAINALGDFVVAWRSAGNFGNDTTTGSVSARRFDTQISVNDNWRIVRDNDGSNSLSFGDSVDNANDGGDPLVEGTLGVDAFAVIQGGVDAIAPGGTVDVLRGTYSETSVNIGKAQTVNVSANTDLGSAMSVNLSAAGAILNFNSTQHLNGLTIGAGALVNLNSNGSPVLVTKSLNVTGKLDLFNNRAIIDYTGATPMASILTALTTGYGAAKNWTGTSGITTSMGNAGTRTLGVAAATDLGLPATFGGQPIDGTAVLIRYTMYGDADLSGQANFVDLGILLNHYNQAANPPGGDFDYSGVVDFVDLGHLLNNFNSPALPVLAAAAVPPGASLAVAADSTAAGVSTTIVQSPKRPPKGGRSAAFSRTPMIRR